MKINIHRIENTELAVTVRSPLFAWMGGVGALALLYLAYLLVFGDAGGRVTGVIGVSMTCALAFLAFYEKADFSFNLPSRTMTWSRQKGFIRHGGTLGLDAIDDVVLQSGPTAEKEYPSYRVVLMAEGRELPLSISYAHDGMNEVAAKRIRMFLGLSTDEDGA